jgi:sortase B
MFQKKSKGEIAMRISASRRDGKKRGGKAADIITGILVAACLTAAAGFGMQLYSDMDRYAKVDRDNRKLVKEVVRTGRKRKGKPGYSRKALARHIDFARLKKINPDIIGWIYLPGTGIDNAVLKGHDNGEYLHHSYRGQYSFAGSIFMDTICSSDFASDNTILYGHNMKNGSMFAPVKKIAENDEVKSHPYVYVYLPDGSMNVYATFSADRISAESHLYAVNIDYHHQVAEILDHAISRSDAETVAKAEREPGQLLMMSTCSAPHTTMRDVLFSRLDMKTGK